MPFLRADDVLMSPLDPNYAGDDPVNEADPTGLAPQPPTLSPEEKQALSDKANGLPYNKAAYNTAIRKLQQAGKYGGQRSKGKQRGRGRPKYTIVSFPVRLDKPHDPSLPRLTAPIIDIPRGRRTVPVLCSACPDYY